MIHTLEITHRVLSSKHFNEIYKTLTLLGNSKPKKVREGCYVTTELKEYGFTQIQLTSKKVSEKYKYNVMQIKIILNPKNLIEANSLKLMKSYDIERVKYIFNDKVKSIHPSLPIFEYWTVKRIDYAIDIVTKYVEEYIILFQRGDKPKVFSELYCNKSKVRKQREGSFYIFNKSVNVNFYNKENEQTKKGFNNYEIKNLLRLEVQCKNLKVNSIKKKNRFKSNQLINYLSDEESKRQIYNYYGATIGRGTYYKLSKAIELVNKSTYSNLFKKKLIKVLKLINKHRSIWKAREKKIYNEKSFNKYLELLRNLDINPVTLPIRWNIEKLPNILNC